MCDKMCTRVHYSARSWEPEVVFAGQSKDHSGPRWISPTSYSGKSLRSALTFIFLIEFDSFRYFSFGSVGFVG
jgi:hypothetical protein